MSITPFIYHQEISNFLEKEEPNLWKWFNEARIKESEIEEVKLSLLKSTYRIEEDSEPELYKLALDACQILGIEAPITLYQANSADGLNASLSYIPNEVHIIMYGSLSSQLNNLELKALFGHELTHFLFSNNWEGRFFTARAIINAMINDINADDIHINTMRLFSLYEELMCDRGSLLCSGDIDATISLLVKFSTGAEKVDSKSFLKQADEIFGKSKVKTDGVSHPEAFIRARALKTWHEKDEHYETAIKKMIEGQVSLDEMDLLSQDQLQYYSKLFIDHILSAQWMQSNMILGHAKLFFDNYIPPKSKVNIKPLKNYLNQASNQTIEYFCYLLLDFIVSDPDLEDAPAAYALSIAEELSLQSTLEAMIKKELKMSQKALDKIKKNRDKLIESIVNTLKEELA